MPLELLADRLGHRAPASLLLSSSVGTFGGGGGGGVFRNVASTYLPRIHRRRARRHRRQRQHAAVPEQPAPVRIGELHLAEARAVDAGDAVVLAPAARPRTCSRRSAAPSRCGSRAGCARRASRFPCGTPCGCCRRSPGTSGCPARPSTSRLRNCSHWPVKLAHQRVGALVGKHPRAPGPPARRARAAARPWPGSSAADPGCCSTGRTRAARPARRR